MKITVLMDVVTWVDDEGLPRMAQKGDTVEVPTGKAERLIELDAATPYVEPVEESAEGEPTESVEEPAEGEPTESDPAEGDAPSGRRGRNR